jgi:hypothetical protein
MSTSDMAAMTENERWAFAEAFERAHAAGEISDRDFARARIEAALARRKMQTYEAAGKPRPVPDSMNDEQPDIERVGIAAIDEALPFLKPNGEHPRLAFLNSLSYLMLESDDAIEIAGNRADACDKAAALLREAAELLKGADNEPLGRLVESISPWAEHGKYGRVFPHEWKSGHLYAEQLPDALSASLRGKRGKATRDGAIARILAQHFPDEPGFFTNGGNALISRLAALCGAIKATPAYVRSTLEQGRRTAPQPETPPKAASPDESLLRLFRKP